MRFYQPLSSTQQRNLERLCQYRIINHRNLILNIFRSIHVHIKDKF
ncbi:MAG: hypothetical protein ACTS77_04305 [Arsenophonus sp. NC-TX2-MAG3]